MSMSAYPEGAIPPKVGAPPEGTVFQQKPLTVRDLTKTVRAVLDGTLKSLGLLLPLKGDSYAAFCDLATR